MKSFPKSVAWALLSAAGILFACGTSRVSAADPMLVVSASSVQAVMDDITYITELAGVSDAGKMAVMVARPYTAGLDKARPIGLTISPTMQPLIFVPVDDLKTTLAVLKEQIGEPQDAGDGVLELSAGVSPVFIKEQNKWAFLSQTAEGLKDLPADPLTMLGKLPKQYDLAVRAFVQRIPGAYRDMALNQMKSGAEEGLRKKSDESDAAFEARKKIVEEQLQQMTMLINETEDVTLGIRVDRQANVCQLDTLLTAVEGSKLARQCQSLEKAESRFGSLLKDASAIRIHLASSLSEDEMGQAVTSVENMRQMAMSGIDRAKEIPDAETREFARQIASQLIDVLLETVKSGRMDAAVTVKLNPQDVSMALAGYVADPKKVEDALVKVFDKLKSQPDAPQLKQNAEEYSGVKFHKLSIDVPANEAEARRVIGSKLDFGIGIGKDAVYVCLGDRGMKQVKAVIDEQSKPAVPLKRPMHATLSLAEILTFARAVEEDNPMLKAVAEMATEVKGQDNVRLLVQPLKNGVGYRLEMEQGVIKLIGKAAQPPKP